MEAWVPFSHGWDALQTLITRSLCAGVTALLITLILGGPTIRILQKLQMKQVVREKGPQSHLKKSGTPTMGGVLIISAIVISTLLWADWRDPFVWVALLALVGFAAIGWADDHLKVILKNSRGLRSRWKYFWQSVLGIIAAIALYYYLHQSGNTQLLLPFAVHNALPLGVGLTVLSYFVIVGTSNAVNLTDGLDGLVIVPVILVAGGLGLLAYLTGTPHVGLHSAIAYVPGAGEMTVVCAAMMGAGLGFLWFNAHPAEMFMGDVGALALGAGLGVIAIVIRQEIVLFIMGGIFVLETVSVMLQVGYFRLSGGKRIFKMAPIHHHFELKGWPETKVVIRFWIITVLLVSGALALLLL